MLVFGLMPFAGTKKKVVFASNILLEVASNTKASRSILAHIASLRKKNEKVNVPRKTTILLLPFL
jgi:hypothetical protein